MVFTKIAGRVHTIKASLDGYDATAETTVEVLPPKYDKAYELLVISKLNV